MIQNNKNNKKMSDIPGQFLPCYVTDDIRGFSLQGAPNTHLNYVRKQQRESKESFCWIEIPISLLLCWETIHQHCSEFESYITLFNQFIPGAGFAVRRDCKRVEERLRSKCYATLRKFRSLSGRKKQEFACEQSFKINLFVEEVLSLDDMYENYSRCVSENNQLEKDIKTLYEEMEEELKKCETREEKLLDENKRLEQYVKKLERYSGNFSEKNTRDISKASPTTKWRYLKELKTRAQKALWFMQQFGLNVINLQLQQNDGVCQNINLNESQSTTSAATASCLSEDGKSEIEKVLFLMDKFGVSEDFYHELTMTFSDLPRSYLVKKTKHELNKQCHLTKTPGEAPGVQCSFKELLKEHISALVSVTVFKQFSIAKIKSFSMIYISIKLKYLLFVSEKFD